MEGRDRANPCTQALGSPSERFPSRQLQPHSDGLTNRRPTDRPTAPVAPPATSPLTLHCYCIALHCYAIMALRELPFRSASTLLNNLRPAIPRVTPASCRYATTDAVKQVEDSSSFAIPPPSEEFAKTFDPIARSRLRRRGNKQLPPSRYIHTSPPPPTPNNQTSTMADGE